MSGKPIDTKPNDSTPINTTSIDDLDDDEDHLLDIDNQATSPSKDAVPPVEIEPEVIDEHQNPVLVILGKKYDIDSIAVGLLIICIWILIWKTSGLWKTLRYDISFTIIFFLFIFYNLTSIVTAGTASGSSVYELNILLTVEQMISILFGTIVLFALFGKNLPVHENCRPVVLKIVMSIVVVLTTASLWVSVWTSGRAFRTIRRFKQGIYNVALVLFIIVSLIFIKGNKCPDIKNPGDKITSGDWHTFVK